MIPIDEISVIEPSENPLLRALSVYTNNFFSRLNKVVKYDFLIF